MSTKSRSSSTASDPGSIGESTAKKWPKVLTASDKVVKATGSEKGFDLAVLEKPVTGEDYSKVPEEQREAVAKQIEKARMEKRRDINTPLFERGGKKKKHTQKHKKSKKTKRHTKKKVHHRRR